jgi:hypothetical protein
LVLLIISLYKFFSSFASKNLHAKVFEASEQKNLLFCIKKDEEALSGLRDELDGLMRLFAEIK